MVKNTLLDMKNSIKFCYFRISDVFLAPRKSHFRVYFVSGRRFYDGKMKNRNLKRERERYTKSCLM